MFGSLGTTELVIILIIVLLVFGTRRLPNVSKDLGGAIRAFREGVAETEEARREAVSPLREALDRAAAMERGVRLAFALNALFDLYDVTPYRLARDSGVDRATIGRWQRGETQPQQDKLEQVLDVFPGLSPVHRQELLALAGFATAQARLDLARPVSVYLSCHGEDLSDERTKVSEILCHPVLGFNVDLGDVERPRVQVEEDVRRSDYLVLVQGWRWVPARQVEYRAALEAQDRVTGLYFQKQGLTLQAEAEQFQAEVGRNAWHRFSEVDELQRLVCDRLWSRMASEARAGRPVSMESLVAVYVVMQLLSSEETLLPGLLTRLAAREAQPPRVEVIEPAEPVSRAEEPISEPEEPVSEPKRWRRRRPQEPEMVYIRAGWFLMGSDPKKDKKAYENEQPQHRLYLPAYYLAKTPATNAQYAAFVEATGHRRPSHWKEGRVPNGKEEHPVVYVSWHDAVAYCQWLAQTTGKPYRLPSEAEWEKGARGTKGWIYPWGNEWDPERCNSAEKGPGGTTPVGAYLQGASPYGLLEMAGNVWEWTASLYQDYPYRADEGREDPSAEGSRVLRGGSFVVSEWVVRCACRYRGSPDGYDGGCGLRVAAAPFSLFSGL